jgi:hypothetical protein
MSSKAGSILKFDKNNEKNKSKTLKGTELTNEQVSDVYTAGTSDGVIEHGDEKVIIKENKIRR